MTPVGASLESAPTAPARIGVRHVAMMAGVAVAYFVAARFGLSLAFATRQVTALWPPTGIAVAALLLFGYRTWPAVFVAAFAVNALIGDSTLVALGVAVGNTLGPLVAVFGLRRLGGFDCDLTRVRDVFALILFGAIVGMSITASNGVANLALGGIVPWSSYGSVWWVWWVGDAMGVLVFAPLVLGWRGPPRMGWTRSRLAELGCLFGGLALACLVALTGSFFHESTPFQLQYAVFPFIIWVALRFRVRETSAAAALVTGFATWGAIHDRGPFTTGNLDERLVLLEMFMAVVTVTGLVLSAATAERTDARQALQRAHDELEGRVRDRTAALVEANTVLAQKNEEVEAFVYIVSHDLRAPLVNLQGFSKELERSCRELEETLSPLSLPADSDHKVRTILHDGVADALRYISASTTKFQRLIDALLLLSRTGKQEFRHEAVDVRAVVDTTVLSLRQSIERSEAEVDVDSLPPAVGDVTAIGQVFSNLISNALKYRQPGRACRIRIGGESTEGFAHYWVRDNGAGVPKSSQRRLFQVFQRFHPDLASGEGMGLAIVKRVVERHGGRVWAESDEGIGTTFHMTLPAPAAIPERTT